MLVQAAEEMHKMSPDSDQPHLTASDGRKRLKE